MDLPNTDSLAVVKVSAALALAFSTLKTQNSDYLATSNRSVFLELLRRYTEAYEIVEAATNNADLAKATLDRIKSGEQSG